VDVATGALSRLTTVPQLTTISPDGLMLAYNVFDEATPQYTLYRSRADGSEAVVIQTSDQVFSITWRPHPD
jgi:hypothetical protein